jgi:hypothetical protein
LVLAQYGMPERFYLVSTCVLVFSTSARGILLLFLCYSVFISDTRIPVQYRTCVPVPCLLSGVEHGKCRTVLYNTALSAYLHQMSAREENAALLCASVPVLIRLRAPPARGATSTNTEGYRRRRRGGGVRLRIQLINFEQL